MKLLYFFVAVLGLTFGALCRADDSCPNRKASDVEPYEVPSGETLHCGGIVIEVFGLHIEIFGTECRRILFHFPAHHACFNEYSEGTFCKNEGHLPVMMDRCECAHISIFGVHLLAPKCECTSVGIGGTVEDAFTGICIRV